MLHQVWGFLRAENIEIIHRKYLKNLLQVKSSTTISSALYGELVDTHFTLSDTKKLLTIILGFIMRKKKNCGSWVRTPQGSRP